RTDMSGEVDERGMLEQALRRELHAERRARLGHDACSMERAAADLEEVVFRRDVLHAEDLLPDVGNLTFQSFRHARHLPMELYFGLDLAGRPDRARRAPSRQVREQQLRRAMVEEHRATTPAAVRPAHSARVEPLAWPRLAPLPRAVSPARAQMRCVDRRDSTYPPDRRPSRAAGRRRVGDLTRFDPLPPARSR